MPSDATVKNQLNSLAATLIQDKLSSTLINYYLKRNTNVGAQVGGESCLFLKRYKNNFDNLVIYLSNYIRHNFD